MALTDQEINHVVLPPNVRTGPGTVVLGKQTFHRFNSEQPMALVIGSDSTMDGVHFALGKSARVRIGSHCYLTNVLLVAELELVIGDYVIMGWNATVADSDFHPIGPAERIADAIALSPLGAGRPRPQIISKPVVIEDNVWVGANATILKGVRIGSGAFIEPGSLVTHDVPPRARVLGNPARITGEV